MKLYLLLLFLLLIPRLDASEKLLEKSSLRLQNKISSLSVFSDTTLTLWVTLDAQKTEKIPVLLSEESLRRRKKVDPQNFLRDKRDSTFVQPVLDSLTALGADIRHVLYWFDAVSLNLPLNRLEALAEFSYIKNIDVVQKSISHRRFEVEKLEISKTTLSKSLALPYGFSQFQNRFIKADKLHVAGLSGRGVRIAMFDTGFKTTHRVFDSANIISTYNFIDNNSDVTQDDCEFNLSQSHHGTMTFGIVGGYLTDTLIGVAYNAEFLLAKTEISCGNVEIWQEEDNWIVAAQWADQLGADIISSSLGYITFTDSVGYTFGDLDGDTPRITAAADIAASKNILVINSAGNERGNSWNHIITPADGDSVIAVGAVYPDSNFTSFSSPGPSSDGRIKPDITTLGTSVVSALYTGGFTSTATGTSFSAPLVTGGIALAIEHDSTLTADELRDLIRRSGNHYSNPDNDYGYGLFDATKAANIVSFKPPHRFSVESGVSYQFLLQAEGRSTDPAVLTLLDVIPNVSFVDNNDGTGYLDVLISENQPIQIIRMTADVGYFVDTTEFLFANDGILDNKLVVGPNPCRNQLEIYFYDPANFKSLAIHNISGEKVWERFNNLTLNADKNRIEARWNCNNQSGEVVADGVYIVVVSTGGKQFHRKVLKIE